MKRYFICILILCLTILSGCGGADSHPPATDTTVSQSHTDTVATSHTGMDTEMTVTTEETSAVSEASETVKPESVTVTKTVIATTRKPTTTVKPTTTRIATTTAQADPEEWQGTWDIDAIIADAKAYAESLGLEWDTTRTKDNSTWVTGIGTKPYRFDQIPVDGLKNKLHERILSYASYSERTYVKIFLLVEHNSWYPNDYEIIPLLI